ncbi:hypothetical protein [Methylobacterium segetis]|uniref:hypothetical protein n=1 Tax=Methylobacterium segetis TaxID=2488750 RepID=UPI001047DB95|nr:hypothetical protein [Methylobacterium segetis]
MNLALSRPAQRRLKRLTDANETVIEADRRFFERFPHRTYRVRRMARTEIAQLETIRGAPMLPLAPTDAAFTVVKQLAPGVRLRIQVPGPSDEDGSDLPDEVGAWLWDRYANRHPWVRQREAMMLAAMRLPGGPLHEGGKA